LKNALKLEVRENEFKRTWFVRTWMSIVWIVATSIMIWFIVGIASQYISSTANPSSKVSINQVEVLPLPSVTVCNWNQEVGPFGSCQQCQLSLVSCQNLSILIVNPNANADCSGSWSPRLWNTSIGLFYCYEFNNNPNNVINSVTTGYSGSLATIWSVVPFPPMDPPSNRAGLQATFAVQNTTTPTSIVAEVNFAPTRFDTFFSIQYVNTFHSEKNPTDPIYNTSRYTLTSSLVKLQATANETIDYIGVSFAFDTLSVQEILFSVDYTILNFFGDFAGMIGTLMGLDVIKVAIGIPTTYFAFKFKACWPLEEIFNG